MKVALWLALGAMGAGCGMAPAPGPGNESGTSGESGESGDGETGSEDLPEAPTGTNFRMLLTDAPGDFDEVWVDIASVEIHSDTEAEGSWITLVDEPQSFDLLTLQNDVTAVLGDNTLEPGYYGQLRLMVDNAFVVADGVSEDLKIASGAQTGIKINLDTEVVDGMTYQVTLDFDAHKSVKQTGKGWLMTPVIHIKDLVAEPIPEEGEGSDSGDDGSDSGSDSGDDGSDSGSDSGDDGSDPDGVE